ncbi:TRAP-type C4-dicarboxylate transport system, small permease component [Thiothrix eikelboomii]|uniref:TRAP transporter small permease protein n=1 Tax=Thiothrix eikelboomii TaxID=92487 RepID=A0A1T4W1Z7_9GAMM|nr:TRAP transporter small permease [Thiothrix eikelboomii]SKA71290.1 TRAP-type C4-dicarboxylate transport system, small permease component [Thiothrix eikelboomii]
MKRFIDVYCRVLSGLMVLLLALMVILVFGNVVLRYGFNSGLAFSEEVSRWLFVWLTFMGAVVALHEKAHMGLGEVVSALSPKAQRISHLIALVLMLWVTYLILTGSWAQTLINVSNAAPVTGWSQAWFYGVGVFFAISSGLILLVDVWDSLRNFNQPIQPKTLSPAE